MNESPDSAFVRLIPAHNHCRVDSRQLTPAQVQRLKTDVWRHVRYFERLMKRCKSQFGIGDQLYGHSLQVLRECENLKTWIERIEITAITPEERERRDEEQPY